MSTDLKTQLHRILYTALVFRPLNSTYNDLGKLAPMAPFSVCWAANDMADIEPVLHVRFEGAMASGALRKICLQYGTIHQESDGLIAIRRPRVPWWITMQPPYEVKIAKVAGKGDDQAVVAFIEPNLLFNPDIPDGMTEAL